jgi:bacillithiol system protein YtxJ
MRAVFNKINSVEELEQIFTKSYEKPVALFKHSSTCPISAGVYDEIQNVEGEINLVVVQYARNVSNEIAVRTGVRHESPQAIVLKDGKAIYHASHYDVTAEDINSKLKIQNEEFENPVAGS